MYGNIEARDEYCAKPRRVVKSFSNELWPADRPWREALPCLHARRREARTKMQHFPYYSRFLHPNQGLVREVLVSQGSHRPLNPPFAFEGSRRSCGPCVLIAVRPGSTWFYEHALVLGGAMQLRAAAPAAGTGTLHRSFVVSSIAARSKHCGMTPSRCGAEDDASPATDNATIMSP